MQLFRTTYGCSSILFTYVWRTDGIVPCYIHMMDGWRPLLPWCDQTLITTTTLPTVAYGSLWDISDEWPRVLWDVPVSHHDAWSCGEHHQDNLPHCCPHNNGHFSTHICSKPTETWWPEGSGKEWWMNSVPLIWTLQSIWATMQEHAKAGTGWLLMLLSIWWCYWRHSRKVSNLWEEMEVILQGRAMCFKFNEMMQDFLFWRCWGEGRSVSRATCKALQAR